ncbi:YeeE/YedE family protein [Bdellovibrio sp. NC01]|uniref:YeeE/YedE family protein n=1 Tax=Bdellovibrio sp. NC01 TaxID=2220073 RepID=UPI00115AF45D|nr:YeeE/YedE thiosulfate transporter family protein [Bdellovibrio sp. NC01]QDK38661.1 YeeE/YedE family protein [Bdellovibrio sp. NC01]
MTQNEVLFPLLGGVLIGLAVTFMLLFNGRVTGISGIIAGSLNASVEDLWWRLTFITGLIVGGLVLRYTIPDVFTNTSGRDIGTIALAGLLVGFGTVMGGGCTSGHGVCGISRFSPRSIVATVVFILFGVVSVMLYQFIMGAVG